MVELSMTEREFPKEDSPQGFVNWFSSYQNDSMRIPYYPATQEEIDQLMALYNAAEGTSDPPLCMGGGALLSRQLVEDIIVRIQGFFHSAIPPILYAD